LLQEAAAIGCLADFEELPLDLQVVALRRLIEMSRACYRHQMLQVRLERAWTELDMDDPEFRHYEIIG